MSAKDHLNNPTALYNTSEVALVSDLSTDYIKTVIGSFLPNELINIKRLILDESGNSFETVLEALKT